MPRVVYAPAADDDLLRITEYIACDKPEAARRWLDKVRAMCKTLSMHQELGEPRPEFGIPGCRSFSVGNYVIFFRSVRGGIEIARIIHGSRDIRNP